MFKYLLILALGVAIGYGYGWKDAQVNDVHIAERLVSRIGGDNKGKYASDIDATMKDVEGR